MKGTIQSDLIRGNINTIILKTLNEGDRYGYDIIKEIEQKSSGQYKLKQPTLYSCLKRLEIQGFITSYWGAKTVGGRRKYYTLTDMGKELFLQSQDEWVYSRTVIDKLISDKTMDLYDNSADEKEFVEEKIDEKEFVEEESEQSAEDEKEPLEEPEESEDDYIRSLNQSLYAQGYISSLEQAEKQGNSDSLAQANNQGYSDSLANVQTQNYAYEQSKTPDFSQNEMLVTFESQPESKASDMKFVDTNALLQKLYEQESKDAFDSSYGVKITSEKYVADRTKSFASKTSSDFDNDNQSYDNQPYDINKAFPGVLDDSNKTFATSGNNTQSSNYFKDFYDENEETATAVSHYSDSDDNQSFAKSNIADNQSFAKGSIADNQYSQHSKSSSLSEPTPSVLNETPTIKANNVLTNEESAEETAQSDKNKFYNYHEPINTGSDPTLSLLDREYRNILGSFINASFEKQSENNFSAYENSDAIAGSNNLAVSATADIVSDTNSDDKDVSIDDSQVKFRHYKNELKSAMKKNEKIAAKNSLVKTDKNEDILQDDIADDRFTHDDEVNKKFKKLTQEVRDMGENVKIRTHNTEPSKQYSKMFYYYSNKLMLTHYAIMFGIMIAEILLTCVLVFLGLQIKRNAYDIWYYVGAVVISLVFPAVAFIKNYTSPNKRKRINFSIRSSLIYRIFVMLQCFLIIYCFNLFIGMPLPFDIKFLTSLLLPAIMVTNFPVSALVFNSLYKSNKYSVNE